MTFWEASPMEEGAFDEGLACRVLRAACAVLGYEGGHLAEFRAGEHIIRAVHEPQGAFGFQVGDVDRLEHTLCQRAVDGRLEHIVPDVHLDEDAREVVAASGVPVRAFAASPVRFPDSRLFGTLCCVDRCSQPPPSPGTAAAFEHLADTLGHMLYLLHRDGRVARERDELLQSIAHDLRTPLQSLCFLGQDLATGAVEASAAGVQVDREAGRVLSMLEDMMLVTRHRAGTALLQPQPADVGALCREAIALVRGRLRAGRHSIDERLPAEPVIADVDANRIIRALQNLLSNAVGYSPDGGTIRVALAEERSTFLLAVTDQGMGIEPEDLGRITTRFFRSPRAVEAGIVGTGLGLTTVQAVADMHEGTLTIDSKPGRGSTFTLRLPMHHGPPRRT